jgi:hypothetical protein
MDFESVGDDMLDTILIFIVYGYHPGSCAEALLREDLEGAMAKAHPWLKHRADKHDTYVEYYLDIVKSCVPDYCKKENFDTWRGFDGNKSKALEEEVFVEMLNGMSKSEAVLHVLIEEGRIE